MNPLSELKDPGKVILADEVYQVVGAAMEVYYTLGCGFLETVYQEALRIELRERRIPFRAQERFSIEYKDHVIERDYVADFFCFEHRGNKGVKSTFSCRLVAGDKLSQGQQLPRRIVI